LANRVSAGPKEFLTSISYLERELARRDLLAAVDKACGEKHFPKVVNWTLLDEGRITLIPPDHWLLIEDVSPFRASLSFGPHARHVQSIQVGETHIASFAPGLGGMVRTGAMSFVGDSQLRLERYAPERPQALAHLRFLAPQPSLNALEKRRLNGAATAPALADDLGLVLLTNGIGGMARMAVDLGQVSSKYDCVLGANLHPAVPVDRHIFVKRIRAWVVADGFISALNAQSLVSFTPGPPARWCFVAGAGDRRAVEIHLVADMLDRQNTTVLRFTRPKEAPATGRDLPPECIVSVTVRVDLVDRNFHSEAHRDPGLEAHFNTHLRPLPGPAGFEFTPTRDRQLRVFSDGGFYHHQTEWCLAIEHPVDASRGQMAREDAYSPGWFELPMAKDASWIVTLTSERSDPGNSTNLEAGRLSRNEAAMSRAEVPAADAFGRQLALAVQAFVVRRHQAKTVIAGYPWFLDWGRDSLICARGLLAAGMGEEVRQLLITFGRFEENGTLPNTIHGEDASNRDTSDAPLWYGLVCEEARSPMSKVENPKSDGFYDTKVDGRGRTIADVLRDIGVNYIRGTPNGIRMDSASALIWSPSHFTWMDTNYPAATPREGYPVEIQVLWISLLRQLARLGLPAEHQSWSELAQRAEASLEKFFWLEERGYLADLLIAGRGQPAATATPDNALRSNYLLAVSVGLLTGERARRSVEASLRYLVVPGALRSLAPLPVSPRLPVRAPDGRPLNDPDRPYRGRYQGDEDTSRKPAYHNGTAWTWTFPIFCEALARAWDFAPEAVAAAQAYLGSMDRLLTAGCLGQIPEIIDGDTPHTQRGCDAQAWGATEALRVWKLLGNS
jgi:predicted glycogen debranching enzyme